MGVGLEGKEGGKVSCTGLREGRYSISWMEVKESECQEGRVFDWMGVMEGRVGVLSVGGRKRRFQGWEAGW